MKVNNTEADEHQPKMETITLSAGLYDVICRLAKGEDVYEFERALLREEMGL